MNDCEIYFSECTKPVAIFILYGVSDRMFSGKLDSDVNGREYFSLERILVAVVINPMIGDSLYEVLLLLNSIYVISIRVIVTNVSLESLKLVVSWKALDMPPVRFYSIWDTR